MLAIKTHGLDNDITDRIVVVALSVALHWILLALMFLMSFFLHHVLRIVKIPSLLAPFFVGLLFQSFLPLIPISFETSEIITVFSDLGIVFLLFLIGVNIDSQQLMSLSTSIVALALLNFGLSSLFGALILIGLGYPLYISVLVATALATVAEATIAPILDAMNLLRTKVANLIIGPGILDDVAEVILASLASFLVGTNMNVSDSLILLIGLPLFFGLAFFSHRVLMPWLTRLEPNCNEEQMFLLAISVAFLFVGVSLFFGFGVLLGAIVGGLIFQHYLKGNGAHETIIHILRPVAYGFLGPVFFFSIGFNIGFVSLVENLWTTVLLLSANFGTKLVSAYVVGRRLKLNGKSIAVIGLGLSAKFSMGIIPVQILYVNDIINQGLFVAFVAVSAISTATVPFVLAWLINRWRDSIV